ncbi:fasciclin-1-like isoform X1 [Lineus longissimus]|uniref:fasciclin-1-like isoform X1 n=1 Tax=Lineus longissimus TaxID=88925 RepID=UPI002B4CF3B8
MAEFRLLFLIVCSICCVYVQAGAKMDYLNQTPIYSKYAKLITDLGKVNDLEALTIKTVLAPTNDAVTAAEAAGVFTGDKTEQGLCITTHFLLGNAFTDAVLTQDLALTPPMLVMAEPRRGGKVYFHQHNGSFYVENVKLVGPEHPIDGRTIVRRIDKMLCPYTTVNLFRLNSADQSYLKSKGATYFNKLFRAFATNKPNSKMLSLVTSTQGGTFFVPLDKNIVENDQNVIESLDAIIVEMGKPENVDKLEKILESHIIMNKFLTAGFLENGREYPTYHVGKPITVNITPADDSHAEIMTVTSGASSAEILLPDQLIGNGLVHGISDFLNLLYKNNFAEIMTNPHTQTFKTLIPYAEDSIKTTLKNANQNYTIFAVDNLGLDNNDRVIALQSNKPKMTKALQMAIVPGKVLTFETLKTMNGKNITTENGDVQVKVENGEVMIIGGGVKARIIQSDVMTTNGALQILDMMLNVGSTTVYDIISQDNKLSTLKKYFDDFGFTDVLKGTAENITVIGAENLAFVDARKKEPKLDALLKDTTNKDPKYIKDMKQFLSLFILTGAPEIKLGMTTADLKANKVNPKDKERTVGIKGDIAAVTVSYKAQTLDLKMPLSRKAINGQLVVAKDVLVDVNDIRTGQVLGAATTKLHTGLALIVMVFVMRFWW